MDHVIDEPTHDFDFPPSAFTALRRVLAVRPEAYAARRNHLDGPVTGLSPYITHGYLDDTALYAFWHKRFDLPAHKGLLSQLAWRSFFHHVWFHLGDGIFDDQRPALTGVRYRNALPDDILTASTGVPVVDASIRTLYRTGYLHNHQRMWLASYMVHLRKVAWRTGADWMYGHLLDGDLASNHLSWQWVAGTFSTKPYLFNADNVLRFAPALASPGTAIDTGYEALADMAASNTDVGPERQRPHPLEAPPLLAIPAGLVGGRAGGLDGNTARVLHPWSLAGRRGDHTLGFLCPGFHARFGWSARRWHFVLTRLKALCDDIIVSDHLPEALLANAQAIQTLNPGYRDALAALPGDHLSAPPSALPILDAPTRSCAQYMKRLGKLGLLPG